MPPPKIDDFMNWHNLLIASKFKLGLSVSEFWSLTFAEFWPLYNGVSGKSKPVMTKSDVAKLKELEKEMWNNGNVRGTSSKSGS